MDLPTDLSVGKYRRTDLSEITSGKDDGYFRR